MVKICMRDGRRYAGPAGNAGPGGVLSVSEAEAAALVAGGYAERVDSLQRYAAEPEPEPEPEAPAPRVTRKETATSRRAKKREKAVETD